MMVLLDFGRQATGPAGPWQDRPLAPPPPPAKPRDLARGATLGVCYPNLASFNSGNVYESHSNGSARS
jgi:hypothetical protein